MANAYPDTLVVSRRVLRVLIGLNYLMGFLIFALLVATLVAEEPVLRALGVRPADINPTLVLGMRLIMVLGISAVPLTRVILTRLLAIVDTVRDGDPFVAENAARLQKIAWATLGLEVTHLAVGAVAAGAFSAGQPIDIGWRFTLTRWVTVLLLFVLARVFEQGARMREDLEGTV